MAASTTTRRLKKFGMKRLLISTLAALPLISAAPQAAQAQSICYFETSRQAIGAGREYGCRVIKRQNANGDIVFDVMWQDGVQSSYVFWSEGDVEIFSGGRRYLGRYSISLVRGIRYAFILHDSQAVTAFPVSR